MRRPLAALVALGALAPAPSGRAAEPAPAAVQAPAAHDPAHPPIDCPLHRKGVSPEGLRPFAQAEEYIQHLERPDRAAWQKPDEVVAALHLSGDETLVDLGAGSGYFTFRFARALPRGKVVAVDVDPEMVRHVHHRVVSEGVRNVQVVLADPADPGIDPSADVVFLCDVLHHVEGPEAWLARAFAEMKPGARLAVVEFREGRLPEGPPEAMKIPRARLAAMLEKAGFVLGVDHGGLLPYQDFLVFHRPGRAPGNAAAR
jgi:SAM-dependent methyltransferase